MNQCPVCSSEIQDAFGLVECPSCHKILFADFDGTLKIHDDSSAGFDAAEQDIPVHELNEEVSDQDFNTNWNLVDNMKPEQGQEPEPEPELEEEARPIQVLSSIEEINRFASSADSSLKQGALIYNLTIKNIDTQELKDEILEVLKESKLGIDIKKLKFALPILELKDLNPIKVSVIVSRIKHLSVDVEWIQKSIITNEESEV
ncbi:MAG: hypothetical protein V4596_08350 [Bdellovibrionota bacterium]